jgi:hypothetical protein
MSIPTTSSPASPAGSRKTAHRKRQGHLPPDSLLFREYFHAETGRRDGNDLAGDRSAVDYVFIMRLEPLHPLQAQRLGAMSAAEKWEVAKGLLRTARQTRRAGLALRHPDWSAERIEQELARELARTRT